MALVNRYRIVTDTYSGFEVQIKYWWWPFWVQIPKTRGGRTNTNCTIQEARYLAHKHKMGILDDPKPKSNFIEEIDFGGM